MALISVDEAQAKVLASVVPLGSEWVALADADGRTLAADVIARRTQPPAALSAMDGYAVNAAATPAGVDLRVVGEAAAGAGFAGRVPAGAAVRIFTGAPLPEGADAVIIQEEASRSGDFVRFARPMATGSNIRRRGLDFAEGEAPLKAGMRLTAGRLGLAAAMNHARLQVARRPSVALLSTGAELVAPGSEAPEGAIVASNAVLLGALVRAAGGEAVDLGLVGDDPDAIAARIDAAIDLGVDILAVSGGASVGEHDHSRAALKAEGVDLAFWKIAMKPGKPMMFGRRGRLAAFGLPGNPVSAFVCGVLYLAPLVRALLGCPDPLPAVSSARLAAPLPGNGERRNFLRARLGDDGEGALAWPLPVQDSSLLGELAAADALVVRPERAPPAAVGDRVPVIRL